MLTPRSQMDKELKEQEKELSDEIVVLQKKVRVPASRDYDFC